eukprot:TRINITY_DN3264_c0_g1_i1.p1 TRINITY_DN3264_c0_g1~~TRINITY_DN3264_c0_g1_i1.p1  ORF type:complete len:505 (-),score=53.07 TRINITY_DN3264_c0_g1_i1:814-2328(-)
MFKKKKACRDAHGDAVWWDARSSFLCYTVLNSFIAPTIGHFADLYGRKPFLVLSQMFSFLPMGVLLAYNWGQASFIWYYPSYAITNALQPLSVGLAYIADVVEEQHRSAIFGIGLCCLMLGTALAAPIGAMLGLVGAIILCIVIISFNLLYVLIFIPESLPMEQRQQHRVETQHNQLGFIRKGVQGLISATAVIVRSSLFIKLTVILMAFGIVFEGLLDLLRQYLQLILGFSSEEQSVLFIVLGLFSTVTLLGLLQPLNATVGLEHTLQIGVGSTFLQVLIMVFTNTKWEAYTSMVFAGIGCLQIPVIGAIVANNSTGSEQGTVQGAMFGAKSLAQGLGPLLFAFLFSTFTQTESVSIYYPQAPMIFGSIMMFVSFMVSLSIPSTHRRRYQPLNQNDTQVQDDQSLDDVENKLYVANTVSDTEAPLLHNGGVAVNGSGQFKFQQEQQQEAKLASYVANTVSDTETPLLHNGVVTVNGNEQFKYQQEDQHEAKLASYQDSETSLG